MTSTDSAPAANTMAHPQADETSTRTEPRDLGERLPALDRLTHPARVEGVARLFAPGTRVVCPAIADLLREAPSSVERLPTESAMTENMRRFKSISIAKERQMSTFVMRDAIRQESFDWGTIGWRLTPALGAQSLVVMDVTLNPGGGHDFHRHPGQEEMIIVTEGEIIQFIEQDQSVLAPGDSVFLEAGIIHASLNRGTEPARLQIAIGPSIGGETGYGLVDVSDQEPWSSLRPD
jgi:quercetin dioxygenase-like cupin family protein